jgi:hypothetical protein
LFVDDNPEASLDDVLAHYGVKGMKWGQHKDGLRLLPGTRTSMKVGHKVGKKIHDYNHKPDVSGLTRKDARRQVKLQNRQLSRHLQDFNRSPNRSNQIRSARASTIDAHRKYQDVKDEIKQKKGKGVIGKHAARVALNQAANERYAVIHKSEQTTAGEKFMQDLFGTH